MQRIVIGNPGYSRIAFEDADGDFFDPTTATSTVKTIDGTVVATGSPAKAGAAAGQYHFTWTPTTLGVHTITTTAAKTGVNYTFTDEIRVVGRRIVPLSQIVADPVLATSTRWEVLAYLDQAEEALEDAVDFAIVPTVTRSQFNLPVSRQLLRGLPLHFRQVVEATCDGAALDVSEMTERFGALALYSSSGWNFLTGSVAMGTFLPGAYVIDIEHGMSNPPADLGKATRMLARHFKMSEVDNQPYPDRASRIMVDESTEIWMARPGAGAHFGIPEVDIIVERHRMPAAISDTDRWF